MKSVWAPIVEAAMQKLPQLQDVASDQQIAAPHMAIEIDRDAAARLGVSTSLIDETLYDAFGQRQVATMFTSTNQYKVILEVQREFQNDPGALSKIYVPGPGGVQVPLGRLIAFAIAVVITLALVAFVKRSRTGMSILATGMDRGAAQLMGIRSRHVYALTFGLAAGMAAIAGTWVGTVGTFSPAAAGTFTLLSFVIAVLGGLGNMYGALLGGLVIGLVESWAGLYLSGTWMNAIAFLVLVLVLVVRPSGLVGSAYYAARVEV